MGVISMQITSGEYISSLLENEVFCYSDHSENLSEHALLVTALIEQVLCVTRKYPKSSLMVLTYRSSHNTGVSRFIIVPIPPL